MPSRRRTRSPLGRYGPAGAVALAGLATVAVVLGRLLPGGGAFGPFAGEPGRCDAPADAVHAIHAATPPRAGDPVTLQGIVTGVFQGREVELPSDLNAFVLQAPDEAHDGDPATPEGIFVLDRREVQVGQMVRLAGTVQRPHGRTEVAEVRALRVCGEDAAVTPVTLTLPLVREGGFAGLEGMRVLLPGPLAIAPRGTYARFGEVLLVPPPGEPEGADLPIEPTQLLRPGAEAAALRAAQERARIVLDDRRDLRDPDPARHPAGGPLTPDRSFRFGDRLSELHGIVTFQYCTHRIHPVAPDPAFHPVAARPEGTPAVNGRVRLAAANVENWFVTLGERGAATEQERERQRDRLVAALTLLDADLIAATEVENRSDDAAMTALADAMPGYRAVRTGRVGSDAITQGFLYRDESLRPLGEPWAVAGRGGNRPVVAQRFQVVASDREFVAAAAHLRSKGSPCGEGDDDPLQGNCAATRTAGVEAFLAHVREQGELWGDAVVLLGDLNAYPQEDALRRLLAGPDGRPGTPDDWTDLVDRFVGAAAVSYLHDGRAGRLDHALASPAFAALVRGAAVWSGNARVPRAPGAVAPGAPYGVSDHDWIVIGFDP